MNELALFAGAGGGILGGKLLGWNTIGAVEIEEYPRKILLQRQRDGILNKFPIWDDIKSFDGRPWNGAVDIVSGGFPCQDISAAGKGEGIEGERSGLWKEMSRVVREISPQFVFVENSPRLTSRGLHRVLGDLAKMGYDARWCVLGADDAGAPHERKRIWVLGYPYSKRELQQKRIEQNERGRIGNSSKKMANSNKTGLQKSAPGQLRIIRKQKKTLKGCEPGRTFTKGQPGGWWAIEPELGRVAHGVAHRVDRLKGIGNGQSPAVAALAFIILSEGLIL